MSGAKVMDVAAALLRADFPGSFLVLLGLVVVVAAVVLLGVLVEVARERRRRAAERGR
jgi:hypothetical protein